MVRHSFGGSQEGQQLGHVMVGKRRLRTDNEEQRVASIFASGLAVALINVLCLLPQLIRCDQTCVGCEVIGVHVYQINNRLESLYGMKMCAVARRTGDDPLVRYISASKKMLQVGTTSGVRICAALKT